MREPLEMAVADEILSEIGRQRLTQKQVQERAGIKARTWQNWFAQRDRTIPLHAIDDIAAALGMRGSELLRRAEARLDHADLSQDPNEAAAERALAQMPPELREAVRRIAREVRDEQEPPAEGRRSS